MSEILKNDLAKLGFELVDKGDWFDLYTKNKKTKTLVATLSSVDKEEYFEVVPAGKIDVIGAPPLRMLKIINSEDLEAKILKKLFMAAFMVANSYCYKIIIIDVKHRNSLLGIFYTNNHDYNYY